MGIDISFALVYRWKPMGILNNSEYSILEDADKSGGVAGSQA
jgi:hypothetical protein